MTTRSIIDFLSQITGKPCWQIDKDKDYQTYIIHTQNHEVSKELAHYFLALLQQTYGNPVVPSYEAQHKTEVVMSDDGKPRYRIGAQYPRGTPKFSSWACALDGKNPITAYDEEPSSEAVRLIVFSGGVRFMQLLKEHQAEIRAIIQGDALARDRRNDGSGVRIESDRPFSPSLDSKPAHGEGPGRGVC